MTEEVYEYRQIILTKIKTSESADSEVLIVS